MNKALMIALLFCVSSFTGCIGGDDTTQIEEAIEEEKIEPVGTNDLTNISADLESLESELDIFLQDFEALQNDLEQLHMSQNSLENSSFSAIMGLNDRLTSLEADMHHLEEHLDNFTAEVHHNFDNLSDEMHHNFDSINVDIDELYGYLDDVSNHVVLMQAQMNNLTIMHLMDDDQKEVFSKMVRIAYLRDNDGVNTNLSGVDLSGADLSGIDFGGADMSGANLDGARFVGNNFSDANLDNSHANGAYFRLVDFGHSSIQNAHWNAVEIINSDLAHSSFSGTEMHNCIVSDSYLFHSDFSKVKANDCHFEHLDATYSMWSSASLDHSTLSSSNFDDADFSSSVNERTSLVGVTYLGMSFRDSKFSYANMAHSTITSGPGMGDSDEVRWGVYWNTYYCEGNYQDGCGGEDLEFSYDDASSYDNYQPISCVDFSNADMNNTILNDSIICSGGGMDMWSPMANFENAQFRRADMTNVEFGVFDRPDWSHSNASSGCQYSCLYFKNTAFSLADVSGSSFYGAVFYEADFGGSSVGSVSWTGSMWMDAVWTNGETINGRGNPSNWD